MTTTSVVYIWNGTGLVTHLTRDGGDSTFCGLIRPPGEDVDWYYDHDRDDVAGCVDCVMTHG